MSRGVYDLFPQENGRRIQEESNNFPQLFPRSISTTGRPLQNPRRGTHDVWLPYQERAMFHPFPFTRIPNPLHPHVHIFVLDNDFPRSRPSAGPSSIRNTNTQEIPRLPLHYPPPPRYTSQLNDQSSTNESKLSKDEQNKALSKLRKETYNPTTKKPPYKPNYYVRDWNIIFSRTNKDNNNNNEDGKRCAICLEDFEAKEIVTLTPCNHMFHEDCIVPWVKSQGRCPVCRFAIYDEPVHGGAVESRSHQGNSDPEMARGNGMLGRDFNSVIRGMEGEFEWDHLRAFR